ncbi:MAG TPA: sugar-binding protein [Blastocatellia bacterium]|nr:sugar-binding protein [Blastocatellia bacterium]
MKASPGRSVIFILISLLILANVSCNQTKKTRIAFVTNNASDFWTIARKGTEKAQAELPNVEIEFKINSELTAAGQQRIIDDLLAKGVDGIAISPVDPKNQTQLINRAASKALVFTQDSDAPNSNRACYIGTDNEAAGRQAGQLVKEALPEGGKIMVFVGTMDAQNAQDRYRGLKQTLEGTKVEILDIRTDGGESVNAKRNAADTLVKYPDIAGMVGLWAYNGPAILGAVKEAGKVGQVKIVAFDEEDATLTGIKEGAIHGTVVQQPYEFGYQSMIKLAKAINGDKSGIPPSKLDIVQTLAIKKDSVEDFIVKINKLRGRS